MRALESPLLECVDAVEIIHLPERHDRYKKLASELAMIGIDLTHRKVRIPHAPRPETANGFPSRGVYGNYLSHLDILSRALQDSRGVVWVLEDDAIFRHLLVSREYQERLVHTLSTTTWDMCFLGHALRAQLRSLAPGLVRCHEPFKWAHCYLVHSRCLPRLVDYLVSCSARPAAHPDGGRMYIDGAYSMFRRTYPDVVSLVANPVLSVQRGSQSSLNEPCWYDRIAVACSVVTAGRALRDELWRVSGVYLGPY